MLLVQVKGIKCISICELELRWRRLNKSVCHFGVCRLPDVHSQTLLRKRQWHFLMAAVLSAVQCILTDHSSNWGKKAESYSYLSQTFSKLEHQITLILHANMLPAITGPPGPYKRPLGSLSATGHCLSEKHSCFWLWFKVEKAFTIIAHRNHITILRWFPKTTLSSDAVQLHLCLHPRACKLINDTAAARIKCCIYTSFSVVSAQNEITGYHRGIIKLLTPGSCAAQSLIRLVSNHLTVKCNN